VVPCAKQQISTRGRPKLIRVQLEEIGMKQMDDLALEEQQGQTPLFRLSQ
jgi:hypothetical protein